MRAELESPDDELWLSPISTWELLLLIEEKRVTVDEDAVLWGSEASRAGPLREEALTDEVALESRTVGLVHDDPAERFIAATARVYGLALVTADDRLLASRRITTLASR